jgi:hypothetical protein
MMAAAAGLAAPAVLASGVLGLASHRRAETGAPELWISRAGLTERATTGSYCMERSTGGGDSTGACADAGYPLPTRGRLPVRPGTRVILRTSVQAGTVHAVLVRVDGSRFEQVGRHLHVRRLSARRWAVELPARLRSASVLDVSLRWDNAQDGRGDADFWGGFRQDCG